MGQNSHDMMSLLDARNHIKGDPPHMYYSPWTELNAGLWSLFAGASILLGLRLWVKLTRRHGLWYDDWILIVCWVLLLANNSLIIHEYATGYILESSAHYWDDRMAILISISSCGTLINQSLTKTAFAVTLLRMSNKWQSYVLWFCIVTMNLYMFFKVVFQWAKVCDKPEQHQYWRLDMCIYHEAREDFKEGGNVYNIIMDFVFVLFPWLITRPLEMRRVEKIGLCATMSLGMVVAIVAAVRVGWKGANAERDEWYLYRNGVSQVWYSSEITGTIMVQCIPILRTLVRDMHRSLTSKRLDSGGEAPGTVSWSSKLSTKRASSTMNNAVFVGKSGERIALKNIPEEAASFDHQTGGGKPRRPSTSPSDSEEMIRGWNPSDMWPLSSAPPPPPSHVGHEQHDPYAPRRRSVDDEDAYEGDHGLSPPPRRP